MTTYEPWEVAEWTLGDFTDLIGEHINLTVDGAGRSGLVSDAHLRPDGAARIATLVFDGGGSWTWVLEASSARITVHDRPLRPATSVRGAP